ncbi:MAG: AEC family transporter [Anaerolineales bacterium]|nr:AEC family transporter [Anaerolineales bacterium]
MSELLALFLNNLFPVFLIAGAGYLLGRLTGMNPRPFSQVVFYVFTPCLLFSLLTQNQVSSGEILRVISLAAATTLLLGALTWIIARLLRIQRNVLSGVLLTSMFMNAGNFGLPVVYFAFGSLALSYASLYFVSTTILTYTLGVVIASMGSQSFLRATMNLVRVPALYGLILAMLFIATGWQVPAPLERSIRLLADATIPSMLILLGLQLQTASWSDHPVPMTLASGMRLLAGPLLTLALLPLFGLSGAARQAIVLEAAMPTAVTTTLLATEFNAEPSFVSAVVFVTTILTPLTLTPLLAYLGA